MWADLIELAIKLSSDRLLRPSAKSEFGRAFRTGLGIGLGFGAAVLITWVIWQALQYLRTFM